MDKIKYESYDDEYLHEAQRTHKLLDDFLFSRYVLQFVKRYGFKWTVYRIHAMVGSWDRCWALGESAINSGVIRDETDLECAEKLIRFHRSVEEGFRRLEEKNEKDDENIGCN